LLLLLRTLTRLLRLTRTAAAATASPLPRGGLLLAGRPLLRLLWLLLLAVARRSLLLRLLLSPLAFRTRPALLRLLLLRLFPALLLLLAGTALLAGTLSLPRLLPLFLTRGLPGALLELAHLLFHVPRCLPRLFEPHLVVPAVRAAPPSLGIGLLTGGAKDTFRERHR
jgi:hypothetical protein